MRGFVDVPIHQASKPEDRRAFGDHSLDYDAGMNETPQLAWFQVSFRADAIFGSHLSCRLPLPEVSF